MVCKEFSTHKPWEDKISGSWLSTTYQEATSYPLLDKTISPDSAAKDLGVYVDQYLTYDLHWCY